MAVAEAAPPRVSPALRRELYELMVLSRTFETEAERQYKAARIGGYCHLSSGQEAATVGVLHTMQPDDVLVTGYRCHGFALARGVPPEAVMAELFGRRDGCAHGRGGSMHLLDVERGFDGGWGIVAGQLPVATGLALGLVRQGRPQAVLCELSGREIAWSLSRRANGHLDRVRRLSLPEPGYLGEMVAEHRAVVAAVADKDPDQAEASLRHHLRMVLSSLPSIRAANPDYFEEV